MKCPNCGAQGNGKFCEYCGAELPRSAPETVNNIEDNSHSQVINNFYFQGAAPRAEDPDDVGNIQKPVRSSSYSYGEMNRARTSDPAVSSYSYGEMREPQPAPQPRYYQAPRVSSKDWLGTLLFCLLLGFFGGHQFYVGKTGKGFLYLFTAGLFGFGWIIDIILILAGHFQDADGLPVVRDPGAYAWGERPEAGGKSVFRILMIVCIVLALLTAGSGSGLIVFGALAVLFWYLSKNASGGPL